MSDPVVSFVFFVWSDFSIDEVHLYAKRIRKLTELNLLVQPVHQKKCIMKNGRSGNEQAANCGKTPGNTISKRS
ncbi:hypothetical protein [Rheinheimera sp. F8]|uniref:hypothetical protein n=1 Tax=Rheinheimera sp. F8 TaxID=1763998 RepID=UPI001AD7F8A5|nr:hypothetical protein [Rheinheimera sp. F8]